MIPNSNIYGVSLHLHMVVCMVDSGRWVLQFEETKLCTVLLCIKIIMVETGKARGKKIEVKSVGWYAPDQGNSVTKVLVSAI